MTLFKPRIGKVIFAQTTGRLCVIIPKLFFCEVNYILMMGLASKKKKNQLNKMMVLQSIYFGDRILFTLKNKGLDEEFGL